VTQPGETGTDTTFAPAIMGAFRAGTQVLEDGLGKIQTEWDNMIRRIQDLIARVQQELDKSHWWDKLAEWFTDDIKDAVAKINKLVEEVRRKVDTILEAVRKAIHGSFPVLSLFDVGLNWGTKVDIPLSDMSPDMTGSGKIDSWRGPAKLTYEKRVQDQIDAVDNSVEKVKSTANWLARVAQANTAYMVELGDRIAEVVGALVAVVVDTAETASGALTQVIEALGHSSEFVGTVVVQETQYLSNLANRLAEVVTQITELATEYGDHRGLPGGKWPSPVNA
jgi:hypothetical protein